VHITLTNDPLQSTWKYDKNGNDFDAKVGRILSHGIDLDLRVSAKIVLHELLTY
jgi:hypothetical protein